MNLIKNGKRREREGRGGDIQQLHTKKKKKKKKKNHLEEMYQNEKRVTHALTGLDFEEYACIVK